LVFYACPQALVFYACPQALVFYACPQALVGKPFFYLLKHKNGAKLVKKDNKLIAELQQKDLFA
jgi:hypothetical protein